MKNRSKANKTILKALTEYLTKNPEQRFGQALVNLDIALEEHEGGPIYNHVDFYEESEDVLNRVKKAIDEED